ncbi:MAG: cupin domain-containing protein [Candidatus Eisenbacteria bacterium]
MVKLINVENAEARKNPHGVDARALHESEHALVSHITLHPGEALKRHITPVDVLFYVLEGTGVVEVGDEKVEVGPDTLIESPAAIPHCWYNEGSETLRFLVVKVPRPTGPTKVL